LTVEVLEDRTVPAFLAPLDYTGASQPPIVVDVNNDSVPDLVSANGSSQGVEVFLGVGDGSFQAGKLAATGGYAATTRSGDFNHDGKIDLVVVNSSRNLALLMGRGDGTFQAPTTLTLPNGQLPAGVEVGDLNGDGKLDLVITGYTTSKLRASGGLGLEYTYHYSVAVYLGDGSGAFQAGKVLSPGTLAGLGDFDNDGKLDLLTTDSGQVAFRRGNGDGTFHKPTVLSNVSSVDLIADVNGDGRLDIVALDRGAGAVRVSLGNGDGTFGTARSFLVGSVPGQVAVGDFNGDGKLDLATTNPQGGFQNGNGLVSILLGNGDGTFQSAQSVSPGVNASSLVVADFNHDGFADLAIVDLNTPTLAILINDRAW
jgi:hypothetical protein